MGSHRPRHPRRRGEGRHTSLVDDPEYEQYGPPPAAGGPGTRETAPEAPATGAWEPSHAENRTSLVGDPEYREYAPAPAPATGGPGAREPSYGENRTSLVGGPPGSPPGERYVQDGWPRVWRGEYRPAGHIADTVVLGDFGLFDRFPGRDAGPRGAGLPGAPAPGNPGRAAGYGPPASFGGPGPSSGFGGPGGPSGFGDPGPSGSTGFGDFGGSGGSGGPSSSGGPSGFGGFGGAGPGGGLGWSDAFGQLPESGWAGDEGVPDADGGTDGRPPAVPWYRRPQRLAAAAGGLALVAFAGFLLVPQILSHLGIGTTPHSGLCPTCQFPIPSSSPAPPSPAAPASPAMRAAGPRHSRAPVAATQPAAPGQGHAPTAAPGTPGATGLAVYYSETAQGGGGFLARVTVVNHGASPVSGWQLVVALPFDSVSGLTNAQGYDEDDVLFLQPAAADPSIAPGGTLVVTITASGPTTTPAECSFNGTACQ